MELGPKILIAILALVALHALSYGSYFVTDPHSGLGEFGFEASDATDGSRTLMRLVGIVEIGVAAFALLAAWLVLKGDRAGLSVAILLGMLYVVLGVFAFFELPPFDAFFYSITGIAIAVLAGILWPSDHRDDGADGQHRPA